MIWVAPSRRGSADDTLAATRRQLRAVRPDRRQARVQRRDQADTRLLQGRDQSVQVIGADMHIGVGDHQDVMPRRGASC